MPAAGPDSAAEFLEPELRDGPPWVMEEMIAAQAHLPREIAARPDTARLGRALRGALDGEEPILFTGCGTSEHASRAAAAIASTFGSGSAVGAQDAFEARLDPPGRGLVVAISHDAGTAATLDAARGAADAGATTLLVTVRPQRAPSGVEAIATPRQDRSWCHTIGYTSPLLAVALALEAISVDDAERVISSELDARSQRREDADRLAGCTRLLAVGSGVDEITASELALKIEEAAHVPTTPLGAEKVLHGHLPAADSATGLVLLRCDSTHASQRDARAESVVNAAGVLGVPVAKLGPQHPATTPAGSLLAGALALQLFTLELTHVHGTNPDRIRREEELYRLAAEAGVG